MEFQSTCKECGNVFTFERRDGVTYVSDGSRPRMCRECRTVMRVTKAWRRRYGFNPDEEIEWICAHCQKPFTGRKKKYCGDECSRAAAKERNKARAYPLIEHACKHCGKTFLGLKARVYCTESCQRSHKTRLRIDRYGDRVVDLSTKLSDSITSSMATHVRGTIGEMVFDIACLQRAIPVFRSCMEVCPSIDRVVLFDGKWKSVQVKTVSEKGTCDVMSRDRTKLGDWLAIVDISDGRVVVLENDNELFVSKVRMSDVEELNVHGGHRNCG